MHLPLDLTRRMEASMRVGNKDKRQNHKETQGQREVHLGSDSTDQREDDKGCNIMHVILVRHTLNQIFCTLKISKCVKH